MPLPEPPSPPRVCVRVTALQLHSLSHEVVCASRPILMVRSPPFSVSSPAFHPLSGEHSRLQKLVFSYVSQPEGLLLDTSAAPSGWCPFLPYQSRFLSNWIILSLCCDRPSSQDKKRGAGSEGGMCNSAGEKEGKTEHSLSFHTRNYELLVGGRGPCLQSQGT